MCAVKPVRRGFPSSAYIGCSPRPRAFTSHHRIRKCAVRTADYLGELARCCRDFGGKVMVFGSPQQRRIAEGHTLSEATDFAADTFSRIRPILDETGVTLALEPLAPAETDFLTTCREACALLDRLDHPRFALHLDVKAMCSEAVPIPDLIRRFASRTVHFHANDANRRGPGFGDVDFRQILGALRKAIMAAGSALKFSTTRRILSPSRGRAFDICACQ